MRNEILERERIVAMARRWIGTPYHRQGDVLGAGVDCGMLLVRIFVDAGLVAPFDPRPYSDDWFLHRDEEKYLSFLPPGCCAVEAPRSGDVVVFRYGRCYSHGAVVMRADPLAIVHAFEPCGCVIEEDVVNNIALNGPNRGRLYFNPWGAR